MSAAYLLSRYVLGVHPAKPGFSEILIAPQPCDLKWARGTWPSPRGPIEVDWKLDPDDQLNLVCRLPDGMKGTVQVPATLIDSARVMVNGATVEVDSQGQGRFS